MSYSEFTGTLTCGIIGALVYDTITCQSNISRHVRIQITTLTTVAAVLLAFNYTGGFFQPLLASMRTFGCVGYFRPEISIYDHVLVYWIGPTFGAILVTFLYPTIKENSFVSSCTKKYKPLPLDAEEGG